MLLLFVVVVYLSSHVFSQPEGKGERCVKDCHNNWIDKYTAGNNDNYVIYNVIHKYMM